MDSVINKVLHIGKFFYPSHGGIETFMHDLANACHQQGCKQAILVHAGAGQKAGRQDLKLFPFLENFERVQQWGQLGYAPISPGFLKALNQMIDDFQPDIIHLHLPNPSAFWVLVSKKARAIPWVVHWHSDAYSPDFELIVRALYALYRPFETQLLEGARAIIATSPPYLETSRTLQPWQIKSHVIPLGLPPSRLQTNTLLEGTYWPKSRQARHAQTAPLLKVLALGRLTTYKGFKYLISALRDSPVELVIAGSGDQYRALKREVAENGVGDRVHFLQSVDDNLRNKLLAECELVCLPSIHRAEAFGITVLEAMAVGKPALVSCIRGSGLSWLVKDGVTGWHVPPRDIQAITQCFIEIAEQREKIKIKGDEALSRFKRYFEIDHVAKQVLSLYDHTLQ